MRKSRFSEEQIVAIVRESEAPDVTVDQVAKKRGITETTLFRLWRKYEGLELRRAAALARLEQENTRLKKVVAQQALDLQILKEINANQW